MDTNSEAFGIEKIKNNLFETTDYKLKKPTGDIKNDFSFSGLNIPGIDINISNDNKSQEEKEKEQNEEKNNNQDNNNGNSGSGGIDLNIGLPKLGSIPKIPGLDLYIPGMQLPKTDIKFDISKMDFLVPSFSLDLSNPINAVGGVVSDILKLGSIGSIKFDAGIDTKPIEEVAKATEKEVNKVISPMSEYIGDTAKKTYDVIRDVSDPIIEQVSETTRVISEMLGEPIEYLSENTEIRQGDGTGYGEMPIGDSGYVVDASKVMDDTFNFVTTGTILEGTNSRDTYELVSNPQEYINKKSTEEATKIMSSSLGLDEGFSGELVQAIQNPQEFINNKGRDVAVDFVSSVTGQDKGLIGIGASLLEGDIGKAAEKVAKTAATETTHAVLNSIPVVGNVISVIARIFKYSCFLSTTSYIGGLLTKEEYLDFPKFRTRVQNKSKLSNILWVGYLNYGQLLSFFMSRNKYILKIVHILITKNWHKHVKYCLGKSQFSFSGWFVYNLIMKPLAVFAFIIALPISIYRLFSMYNIDTISTYRNIIRIVERKKYGYSAN